MCSFLFGWVKWRGMCCFHYFVLSVQQFQKLSWPYATHLLVIEAKKDEQRLPCRRPRLKGDT